MASKSSSIAPVKSIQLINFNVLRRREQLGKCHGGIEKRSLPTHSVPNSPFSKGDGVSDSGVVVFFYKLFELLSETRHGINDLFLLVLLRGINVHGLVLLRGINVHGLSWRCREGGR